MFQIASSVCKTCSPRGSCRVFPLRVAFEEAASPDGFFTVHDPCTLHNAESAIWLSHAPPAWTRGGMFVGIVAWSLYVAQCCATAVVYCATVRVAHADAGAFEL